MKRRSILTRGLGAAVAGVAALLAVPAAALAAPAMPATSQSILAVSIRTGSGDTSNVDFGLVYGGINVSPSIVIVTIAGYELAGTAGWYGHDTDTKVDIKVGGGSNTWVAEAHYVA